MYNTYAVLTSSGLLEGVLSLHTRTSLYSFSDCSGDM